MNGARGFTLLELVVVIAIVALTAAIAVAGGSAVLHEPDPVLAALTAARDGAVREGRDAFWRAGDNVVRFAADGSSSGGTIRAGGRTYSISVAGGRIAVR